MSLDAVRRALAEARARRLSVEHPVWELARPWWPFSRRARRFEGLQIEILLAAASLEAPLFLVSEENPQGFGLGGPWAHAHAETWLVPPACDFSALRSQVLSGGDWTLYSSHEAVSPEQIPDVFRVAPSEVASFALARGVPLLVQAPRAGDPWRVWVEDVSSQQEQAA